VVANEEVSMVEMFRDTMSNDFCSPVEAFSLGSGLGAASRKLGSLRRKSLVQACDYS
jgi:hypothetical protein